VTTAKSRTPGNRGDSEWLTVEEVCAELKISQRTFYRWRALGTGPRSKRIAGGCVRVRRSWLRPRSTSPGGAGSCTAPWRTRSARKG
jgi:predicted DNA-binding transcriptional regulator AlpA